MSDQSSEKDPTYPVQDNPRANSEKDPKYPVQDNPRAHEDTGNPNDKNKTPGTNPKQSDEPTSKESDPTRY